MFIDNEYEKLSNEELHKLLCERFPELKIYEVTEETRNTAIAILKTIHKNGRK